MYRYHVIKSFMFQNHQGEQMHCHSWSMFLPKVRMGIHTHKISSKPATGGTWPGPWYSSPAYNSHMYKLVEDLDMTPHYQWKVQVSVKLAMVFQPLKYLQTFERTWSTRIFWMTACQPGGHHGWEVTIAFWKISICGAEQSGLRASLHPKALLPE